MSFSGFLDEQRYTQNDRSLIKATIRDPVNLLQLVKTHYDDLSVPEEV